VNLFQEGLFASGNHPLVSLAINSVKHQLEKFQPLPCLSQLPEEIQRLAGTFITIKKKKLLRGCIDTLKPKYTNLA
jgi:AMMECR1 domain-containing protein|tara:strand:+ start:621 stop:848 length:228 start_codon:yes stop_codon:yes gene_type:complete